MTPSKKQLVGILQAVHGKVTVRDVEVPQMDEVADPLDRLALQARWTAERAGLPPSDSPLLRALTDEERAIGGGRAPSVEVATGWLQRLGFRPEHIDRLAPAMLRLSAMNAHFLDTFQLRPDVRAEERRFLDFAERRCSDEQYAAIQERFLNYRALVMLAARPAPGEFNGAEKYLYLPRYAYMKLKAARELALPKRAPANLLDIGSGPGHFGLACEHLGHHYWGFDIEFTPATPFSHHDLYADLFAAFGLQRSLQRVLANTPLEVARRFEMVTCQMGVFPHNRTAEGAVPWGWSDWQFFLRDLVRNVLTPRFEVYLEINFAYLPKDICDRLAGLGAQVDRERSIVRITDAQAGAIVG